MTSKVVYIDDEPALCRVFETVLRARGIDIVTFTDAAEAIAFLDANPVAVVFCDYRMPKISGHEVLAQMTRRVPFYLISGDLAADASGAAAGVTGFLAKPFRAEDLIALVKKHVATTER